MRLQHVTINGHDVAYRTAGGGPVVLLVHGMAGSSVTWKHVMPALARNRFDSGGWLCEIPTA